MINLYGDFVIKTFYKIILFLKINYYTELTNRTECGFNSLTKLNHSLNVKKKKIIIKAFE